MNADNDSIPHAWQRIFMQETYQYAIGCGAIGFGWWEFQDCKLSDTEREYLGVLDLQGETVLSDGRRIIGTVKSAGRAVKNLALLPAVVPARPCNYFNMLGYNNIVIEGQIVEPKTGRPIAGACIRGWNESWAIGVNTFSDENGAFTLYSNDFCTHFEISAPRYKKIKFDKQLTYEQLDKRYNKQNLPQQHLEYQSIPVDAFLVRDTSEAPDGVWTMTTVQPSAFAQKPKFHGKMGVIELGANL